MRVAPLLGSAAPQRLTRAPAARRLCGCGAAPRATRDRRVGALRVKAAVFSDPASDSGSAASGDGGGGASSAPVAAATGAPPHPAAASDTTLNDSTAQSAPAATSGAGPVGPLPPQGSTSSKPPPAAPFQPPSATPSTGDPTARPLFPIATGLPEDEALSAAIEGACTWQELRDLYGVAARRLNPGQLLAVVRRLAHVTGVVWWPRSEPLPLAPLAEAEAEGEEPPAPPLEPKDAEEVALLARGLCRASQVCIADLYNLQQAAGLAQALVSLGAAPPPSWFRAAEVVALRTQRDGENGRGASSGAVNELLMLAGSMQRCAHTPDRGFAALLADVAPCETVQRSAPGEEPLLLVLTAAQLLVLARGVLLWGVQPPQKWPESYLQATYTRIARSNEATAALDAAVAEAVAEAEAQGIDPDAAAAAAARVRWAAQGAAESREAAEASEALSLEGLGTLLWAAVVLGARPADPGGHWMSEFRAATLRRLQEAAAAPPPAVALGEGLPEVSLGARMEDVAVVLTALEQVLYDPGPEWVNTCLQAAAVIQRHTSPDAPPMSVAALTAAAAAAAAGGNTLSAAATVGSPVAVAPPPGDALAAVLYLASQHEHPQDAATRDAVLQLADAGLALMRKQGGLGDGDDEGDDDDDDDDAEGDAQEAQAGGKQQQAPGGSASILSRSDRLYRTALRRRLRRDRRRAAAAASKFAAAAAAATQDALKTAMAAATAPPQLSCRGLSHLLLGLLRMGGRPSEEWLAAWAAAAPVADGPGGAGFDVEQVMGVMSACEEAGVSLPEPLTAGMVGGLLLPPPPAAAVQAERLQQQQQGDGGGGGGAAARKVAEAADAAVAGVAGPGPFLPGGAVAAVMHGGGSGGGGGGVVRVRFLDEFRGLVDVLQLQPRRLRAGWVEPYVALVEEYRSRLSARELAAALVALRAFRDVVIIDAAAQPSTAAANAAASGAKPAMGPAPPPGAARRAAAAAPAPARRQGPIVSRLTADADGTRGPAFKPANIAASASASNGTAAASSKSSSSSSSSSNGNGSSGSEAAAAAAVDDDVPAALDGGWVDGLLQDLRARGGPGGPGVLLQVAQALEQLQAPALLMTHVEAFAVALTDDSGRPKARPKPQPSRPQGAPAAAAGSEDAEATAPDGAWSEAWATLLTAFSATGYVPTDRWWRRFGAATISILHSYEGERLASLAAAALSLSNRHADALAAVRLARRSGGPGAAASAAEEDGRVGQALLPSTDWHQQAFSLLASIMLNCPLNMQQISKHARELLLQAREVELSSTAGGAGASRAPTPPPPAEAAPPPDSDASDSTALVAAGAEAGAAAPEFPEEVLREASRTVSALLPSMLAALASVRAPLPDVFCAQVLEPLAASAAAEGAKAARETEAAATAAEGTGPQAAAAAAGDGSDGGGGGGGSGSETLAYAQQVVTLVLQTFLSSDYRPAASWWADVAPTLLLSRTEWAPGALAGQLEQRSVALLSPEQLATTAAAAGRLELPLEREQMSLLLRSAAAAVASLQLGGGELAATLSGLAAASAARAGPGEALAEAEAELTLMVEALAAQSGLLAAEGVGEAAAALYQLGAQLPEHLALRFRPAVARAAGELTPMQMLTLLASAPTMGLDPPSRELLRLLSEQVGRLAMHPDQLGPSAATELAYQVVRWQPELDARDGASYKGRLRTGLQAVLHRLDEMGPGSAAKLALLLPSLEVPLAPAAAGAGAAARLRALAAERNREEAGPAVAALLRPLVDTVGEGLGTYDSQDLSNAIVGFSMMRLRLPAAWLARFLEASLAQLPGADGQMLTYFLSGLSDQPDGGAPPGDAWAAAFWEAVEGAANGDRGGGGGGLREWGAGARGREEDGEEGGAGFDAALARTLLKAAAELRMRPAPRVVQAVLDCAMRRYRAAPDPDSLVELILVLSVSDFQPAPEWAAAARSALAACMPEQPKEVQAQVAAFLRDMLPRRR